MNPFFTLRRDIVFVLLSMSRGIMTCSIIARSVSTESKSRLWDWTYNYYSSTNVLVLKIELGALKLMFIRSVIETTSRNCHSEGRTVKDLKENRSFTYNKHCRIKWLIQCMNFSLLFIHYYLILYFFLYYIKSE